MIACVRARRWKLRGCCFGHIDVSKLQDKFELDTLIWQSAGIPTVRRVGCQGAITPSQTLICVELMIDNRLRWL